MRAVALADGDGLGLAALDVALATALSAVCVGAVDAGLEGALGDAQPTARDQAAMRRFMVIETCDRVDCSMDCRSP